MDKIKNVTEGCDEYEKRMGNRRKLKNMDAYYYGFRPTGVDVVDEILMAVAAAGKGYHHTEDWNNLFYDNKLSPVDLIQEAARRAAYRFEKLNVRPDMENDRST